MENTNLSLVEIQSEVSAMRKQLNDLCEILLRNESVSNEKQISDLPNMLNSKHLKQLFGVSGVTLYHWCNRSILKPKYIGGRKYFDKDEVLKLLNSKKV